MKESVSALRRFREIEKQLEGALKAMSRSGSDSTAYELGRVADAWQESAGGLSEEDIFEAVFGSEPVFGLRKELKKVYGIGTEDAKVVVEWPKYAHDMYLFGIVPPKEVLRDKNEDLSIRLFGQMMGKVSTIQKECRAAGVQKEMLRAA